MSPVASVQAAANLSAIPLILASVILGALGQLTMKTGFNALAASGKMEGLGYVQKLPLIFMQPWVLMGLAMYVIATFVWFAVLLKAELSFAYPFIALAYVVTVVGSALLFGEHMNVWKYAAIALIILGVLCLAKGAREVASGRLAQAVAS
ncbi:MAG TPA: hypothetical protein VEI97_03975, partial [bacterium]|nr:hypothetical protein [bacterium]